MMRVKRTTIRLPRLLRRTMAFFLAAMGLWLFSLAGPSGNAADWLKAESQDPQLVETLLRVQMGQDGDEAKNLTGWQKMILRQSPLLDASASDQSGQENGETVLPDTPQPTEPDDPEDVNQLPSTITAPDTIVEKTLTGAESSSCLTVAGVALYNKTSKHLDLSALASTSVDLRLSGDGSPQVLIMHTHGCEAFTMDGTDIYLETDTARTTDTHYNIIRVGDEIERIFTEMGISVLHDRNLYDYPAYNGCYDRSKAAVEQYLKDYPSIKVVLDIHRDAMVDSNGTIYKVVSDVDGTKAAQVMLVVGTDDAGLEHPNWQKNLALAIQIQQNMDSLWPTLARPIALRSSRFNQQLTTGSLLVEIGTHGNTLQEALVGARLFARAAGQVLQGLTAS